MAGHMRCAMRGRRGVVARLLVLATLLSLALVGAPVVRPAVAPVAQATGTSPDNRLKLTKTPSVANLPLGGGSVTYTYTVTNQGPADEFFLSFTDDKCGPPNYVSGMSKDGLGNYYLPKGASATWTCTQLVTQTTTNVATFRAADAGNYYWGVFGTTSTVQDSATVTVPIAVSTGANTCSTLWYGSATANGSQGYLGTWDPATGAVKQVAPLPSYLYNGSTFAATTAVAVDPTNPNIVYFTYYTIDSSYGSENADRLMSYNTATGAFTLINTSSTAWETNRLGVAPDGTVWSFATNGHLYSYNPGTNTSPVDHGVATAKTASGASLNFSNFSAGDITFDGLGNMWVLGSDGPSGTTYLLTISAAKLAASTATSGPVATVVGAMTPPPNNGFYDGIAFGADGTLYASATSSDLSTSSLWTVNKDTGAATQLYSTSTSINNVGDLGSCSLPKPQLQVSKTVDQNTVQANGTLNYTITIKNIGNLTASGVTFTDATPSNSTYVSSTLNGTSVGTSGTNYWASAQPVNGAASKFSGVLPAGDTATIKFTVKVNAGATGSVCNQGSAIFTGITSAVLSDDPSRPGSTDQTCAQLLQPKIALDKTADKTTVDGSGLVTYTYKVTNPGNETLKNVTLTDNKCTAITGPAAVDKSVDPPTGDINGDGQLQVGETWIYTCQQTISTTTTNTATVTGVGVTSGQTVTSTDTWTVTVNPLVPNVNVTKTTGSVSGPDANGNYTATWTLTVTNTGNGPATYGPLTDSPAFAANLVPTAASWSGTATGSSTTAGPWTIGVANTALAAGATDTYTVSVVFHYTNTSQAAACAGTGTGLFNSVALPSGQEQGSTSDNAACDAPPAPPTQSLALTKSVKAVTDANGNGFNDAGDVISYRFTVKNTGATTLAPVTITDQLLGLSNWSCVASLAPGQSATCDAPAGYTITSGDSANGSVVNTATATGTPPYTPAVTTPPSTVTTPVAPTGQAVITKTDAASGATLNGAVFSLYQTTASTWSSGTPAPAASVCQSASTGTAVRTGLTTTGAGQLTLSGLQLATYDYTGYQTQASGSYTVYCLVETTAPAGYNLSAQPVTVVATSATQPLQVSVKDVAHNLANALPSAGGRGADALDLGGVGLLGAGLLVVARRRRLQC